MTRPGRPRRAVPIGTLTAVAALLLADLFIFNTLEFWTGSNPMASRDTPQTETVALNDSHTMIMIHA